MSSRGFKLTYLVIIGTVILSGTIFQHSVAQTTTSGGAGGNTTATTTNTTAVTGANATTNVTAVTSPTTALTQPQQPSPLQGGQFKIVATDTRIPGSQFITLVNSTGALRNIISSIAQQPVTGFSGQGPTLLSPPPTGVGPLLNDPSILRYVDQIINDILRMRAMAPITAPPGMPAGLSPVSGSLCYDIGWFNVCVERLS